MLVKDLILAWKIFSSFKDCHWINNILIDMLKLIFLKILIKKAYITKFKYM